MAALLAGCATAVRIESRPPGAVVEIEDQVVTTPDTVHVRWRRFARQPVTVSSPGYRTIEVDLREHEPLHLRILRDLSPFPRRVRRVELVLVPEHGPAGTWTPEDQDLR